MRNRLPCFLNIISDATLEIKFFLYCSISIPIHHLDYTNHLYEHNFISQLYFSKLKSIFCIFLNLNYVSMSMYSRFCSESKYDFILEFSSFFIKSI